MDRDWETDSGPVIVGAGLAGLMTALHLAPRPCVVITTGTLGEHAATDLAQGGIAAAVGADDSPLLHARDTTAAGAGLCDPAVVERVTGAAPAAIEHLAALGARFDRHADGRLRLGLEGAHSRARIVHAYGDGSGREVLRTAVAAVRATGSITVLEHAWARRLVIGEGRVRGLDVEHLGQPARIRTDQVVLATGGAGGLFGHTTNPPGALGQGLALAARAGAELRDLEMVQFHPTALDVGLDPMPLVSEAVRGAGAVLVDDRGRRVLDDDLAARDVVSRAVWAQLQQGRRVFLDARGPGDSLVSRFPGMASACLAAGFDPARSPVPVRPAAHYHMGGVLVDGRGRSTVPGLWACGEVASTGLHGANRLASNSLLEAVVCSRWVAGDVAATSASPGPGRSPGACHSPAASALSGPGRVPARSTPNTRWDPAALQDVRELVSGAAGVLRDGPTLSAAVTRLRHRLRLQPDDDAALVALLICWSALQRVESRGGHIRTDAPDSRPARHQRVTLADALGDACPDTSREDAPAQLPDALPLGPARLERSAS